MADRVAGEEISREDEKPDFVVADGIGCIVLENEVHIDGLGSIEKALEEANHLRYYDRIDQVGFDRLRKKIAVSGLPSLKNAPMGVEIKKPD